MTSPIYDPERWRESPAYWAPKPIRTCRSRHPCCLCEQPIALGDRYRDGGYLRRAHQRCVVVLREVAPRAPEMCA